MAKLLATTVDLFIHCTGQIANVGMASQVHTDPAEFAYVFSQRVKGDTTFDYALALSADLMMVMASHMLQEDRSTIDLNPTALDAVGEFVNMVIGNACTQLSELDLKVTADPPERTTGEPMERFPRLDRVSPCRSRALQSGHSGGRDCVEPRHHYGRARAHGGSPPRPKHVHPGLTRSVPLRKLPGWRFHTGGVTLDRHRPCLARNPWT